MKKPLTRYVVGILAVSLWAPLWWAILLPRYWQEGKLFTNFYYAQHHMIYPMLVVWLGVIPLSISGCLLAFKFKREWATFTVGCPLVINGIVIALISWSGTPCAATNSMSPFCGGGLSWSIGNGIVLIVILSTISLPALFHLYIASSKVDFSNKEKI